MKFIKITRSGKRKYGLYRCACGKEKEIRTDHVKSGRTVSCGCIKTTQKGISNKTHPEHDVYRIWQGMKTRCYDVNHIHYAKYGGRGIKVCEEWLNSFLAFRDDMGPRPSKDHTLDRYPNNDGDYEPGNVRWATDKQQANNRHDNLIYKSRGDKTIGELADEHGLPRRLVVKRIRDLGWTLKQALETPNKGPGGGAKHKPHRNQYS